jgi:hypothetical protein
VSVERIVLYGDFNCPWSYLASRRADVLATDGVQVDWRSVEHQPRRPISSSDSSMRFPSLRDEMDKVLAELLPGEALPYSLAGFVPSTQAALSGYAEAYAAGVADRARQLLFEAFWLHGIDLDDAKVVRTLLVDSVRSGYAASEQVREWGYGVDVTRGPVTTTAWRLVAAWADQWRETGKQIVPVLLLDETAPLLGTDAVDWLGAELLRRGLESRRVPPAKDPGLHSARDLAPLGWASQHGNRWMRDYQRAHLAPLFPASG